MVMHDDDYEIMPHSEISKLKKEINQLRANPGNTKTNAILDRNMAELNKTISVLIDIFKETNMELKVGDAEISSRFNKLNSLNDKLDTLIDQNEKIAEAILTVAEASEIIKEKLEKGDFGHTEEVSPEKKNPVPDMPPFNPDTFGSPEPFGSAPEDPFANPNSGMQGQSGFPPSGQAPQMASPGMSNAPFGQPAPPGMGQPNAPQGMGQPPSPQGSQPNIPPPSPPPAPPSPDKKRLFKF